MLVSTPKALVVLLLFCLLNAVWGAETKATSTNPTPVSNSTSQPKEATKEPVGAPSIDNNLTPYDYEVKNKENVSCILAHFAAAIQITFKNITSNKTETHKQPLTNSSKVDPHSSSCDSAHLVINVDSSDVTLELDFKQEKGSYYVENMRVFLSEDYVNKFASVKENVTADYSGKNFTVPDGSSYLCETEENMDFKSSNASHNFHIHLVMEKVQLDAFRNTTTKGFRTAKECSMDNEDKSGLIPIIVGVALAALVVIVLIGYFIGRSRSRRLAYQSV